MKTYAVMVPLFVAIFQTTVSQAKQPPTTASRGSSRDTASESSLPAEFFKLAKILAEDNCLEEVLGQKTTIIDLTEVISRLHEVVLTLEGIKSPDRNISYVAEHSKNAFADIIKRLERLNTLPIQPTLSDSLFFLLGDLLLGRPYRFFERYKQFDQLADEHKKEIQGLIAALNKLQSQRLLLPKIATQYLKPTDANDPKLKIDFDEAWGPFGPDDEIFIYSDENEIENCLITVQLNGKDGSTRKNVHFISKGSKKILLNAKYSRGYKFLDHTIGRTTVNNVSTIDVTILSPRYSKTLQYVYDGAERDRDIEDRCKNVTFQWRYRPFESGLIWDTERALIMTLANIDFLPKCRVDITFNANGKSSGWYFELDRWKNGQEKIFGHKEMDFDPATIEVEISFPGSNYRIKKLFNRKTGKPVID